MFIDGRGVDDGSTIEADLAIIGAGAAGITIARDLSASGLRIALIESGGVEPDAETQALYAGRTAGIPYPVSHQRLRFFGGSTNHWGGLCRPMEPIDFERRDWVPHSGWPISRDDLDPYYQQASEVCETRSTGYDDPEAWSDGGANEPLPLPGGEVMTRWFVHSPPTRFGTRYRSDIERAPSVQCFLHSNVLEIVVNDNASRVEHLQVGTLTGRRFEIRAQQYVLACGGIENPRVLLLSNSVAPAGVGNDHDLVGRYFAEHPHIHLPCEILLTERALRASYYSALTQLDGAIVTAVLMFTERYLRRHRSTNSVVIFYSGQDVEPGADGGNGRDPSAGLGSALAGFLRSTTSEAAPSPVRGVRFATGCWAETNPNPDSRVRLDTDKDALGLRRAALDWRLSDQDRDNIGRNMLALARAFGQWGEGQVRVLFPDNYDWGKANGGGHHMGTTRMARDPGQGVVDADCRVHGVSNLYVAGSSVFPTYSTVNPTLTIVALALRLADHLRVGFDRGARR